MKKEDLKYGSVVELRNEVLCLYNRYGNFVLLIDGEYLTNSSNYNKSLNHNCRSDWDIVKVYKDYTLKELLWERKEKPKLTEDEKVILRNLPEYITDIWRDAQGGLALYNSLTKRDLHFECFDHLFPFIDWESSYSVSALLECEK